MISQKIAVHRPIGNYEGFTSKLLKSMGIATRTAPRTTITANALAWHRAEDVTAGTLESKTPRKGSWIALLKLQFVKTVRRLSNFKCFQFYLACNAQVCHVRSVSISAIPQGYAEFSTKV